MSHLRAFRLVFNLFIPNLAKKSWILVQDISEMTPSGDHAKLSNYSFMQKTYSALDTEEQMKDGTYLNEVRNQYENYPYPARDPLTEKKHLHLSKSCSLDCLNYYGFEGKKDFSKGFRVLIAGGGTGDDVIYLAEQLRGTDAEIVYLDMSAESMRIAQERAKIRKLDNITWVHDSLLNLNSKDFGKFDFITCTGVLHHLESPDAGLEALTRVLDGNGAMYIMVYATIGRTGVYHMQELMREVNSETFDIQESVDNTKKVLNALPAGNWFTFNKVSCKKDLSSDIGIYDLLLHSQDRAYTVNEMYEFIEKPGLKLNKLYNPDHPLGDMVFYPETFIHDAELLSKIKKLPIRKQQSICELLFGQIMKQCCFVSFKDKKPPSTDELNLVPSISIVYSLPNLFKNLTDAFTGASTDIQINQMFTLKRRPHTKALFGSIDGVRTMKEVVEAAMSKTKSKASFDTVYAELKVFVDVLIKVDMMYLKEKELPKWPDVDEMITRVNKFY
ncbi:MAG: 2-polyprenyl-3-methyl-5-hydroxy-6-metoxy-1,4-benzoquinol methylase [Pseudohongiellaceae bacterium]